ncbi:MAG TPA: DUF2461 family protein [Anaerolineae bacterium]|nr:DUF2461 family protein [Anaerolineae bacterium]
MDTFNGFSKEVFQLLVDLEKENSRGWFKKNAKAYEKEVVEPAYSLIETLGGHLQFLAPGLHYEANDKHSGSLTRLPLKGKEAYKGEVEMSWWLGEGKKSDSIGFHFALDARGGYVKVGVEQFSRDYLQAYRDAMVDDKLGVAFDHALAAVKQAGHFRLEGQSYKRTPRGYDSKHQHAPWLLYSGFLICSQHFSRRQVTSGQLVDLSMEQFYKMMPLLEWFLAVGETVKE